MMTSMSTAETPAHAAPRSEAFTAAVSDQKLRVDGSSRDGLARLIGLVLMIIGVAADFVLWQSTLSLDDGRDIASYQVMALAFVGLTVMGAGLFVAGTLGRIMRLWLLRQMVENQQRHDELVSALRQGPLG